MKTKTNSTNNRAIGVFDSGLGGLTVASAIKKALPEENILYFGDTAHLPYGDKSKESIRRYSLEISRFLLSANCKAIIVACNTASSIAFDEVRAMVPAEIPVINVIEPVINYIQDKKFRKIGVIGTKVTINSGAYPQKLLTVRPDIEVASLQTPLFVPMIEEGFIYDDISNAVIRAYLSDPKLERIDALVLGCTHYPLVKNQIRKFFNFSVKVIDSSETTANLVKRKLTELELLNNDNSNRPANHFFISDYTETFEKISQMFFDDEIKLKKLDIWHADSDEIKRVSDFVRSV